MRKAYLPAGKKTTYVSLRITSGFPKNTGAFEKKLLFRVSIKILSGQTTLLLP